MYHRLAIALAIAAIAAACGGVIDPSQNKVEEFRGTMPLASSGTAQEHIFTISKTGEVSITVTSLTPSVPLGTFFVVALGQVVSNQCLVGAFGTNQFATVGVTALDQRLTSGTYCIDLYDRGFFTVPETYVLKVSHP